MDREFLYNHKKGYSAVHQGIRVIVGLIPTGSDRILSQEKAVDSIETEHCNFIWL